MMRAHPTPLLLLRRPARVVVQKTQMTPNFQLKEQGNSDSLYTLLLWMSASSTIARHTVLSILHFPSPDFSKLFFDVAFHSVLHC